MKIRFRVPEAGDPRRENGLALPPQQSKRVPPKLRWLIITLVALSPAIWAGTELLSRWLWVDSYAYVVFEGVSLNAPADGTVTKLAVRNGQTVRENQLLMELENDELRAEFEALSAQMKAPARPATAGVDSARRDLALLENRAQALASRTRIVRDLASRGAATRGEVLAAEGDEAALEASMAPLRTTIALGAQTPPDTADDEARRVRLAVLKERLGALEVRAPSAGTIDDVEVADGRVVRRGDPLFVLHQGEPRIVAFIEGKDMDRVLPGKRVSIVLPNGDLTTGVIRGLAPSTRRLPDELAGSFDSHGPRLQVLIVPDHLPPDARINRLAVTVRRLRFG
jgi:multidrug resistance efflux pump